MNLQVELYGEKFGTQPVQTRIIKTDNGNYVYSHWFNENNFQGSRAFIPTKNEDKICDNPGQFMNLKFGSGRLASREKIFTGCFAGPDVQRLYEK